MKARFYQQKVMQYGYYFFLTSFIGFIWEIILTLIEHNSISKRGFFYGPWLPIYGIGGVLLYMILHRLKDHHFLCFILSAVIGTTLELTIGIFVNKVFHLRYWDYSDYPFNYAGYICLLSSLGFGLAGVLWVSYFSSYALNMWNRLSIKKQKVLLILLLLLFSIDCLIAIPTPNTGRGITY